ncbi:stage III sporulation protein AB [Paenibacillus sp. CAA11]|uniref:stage III sporulation protein SpoIIIAB n=1 Tax=Paenibacillus sp. CAA11 TaxID=1532905 RepID=UPI000D38A99D|nr:stage III sporulation protein SpoIIIAB [Paenibacillus sp. CAA11]AWB45104.1 stage III sporulation protein AB [Paenibacillus sp. CAA11]
MLKILGAALILLASTLAGWWKASGYAARPHEIRRLILALRRMETEIGYGFTPLPEAFSRIGAQNREPLRSLFIEAAEAMGPPRNWTAQDSLHHAIRERWKYSYMKAGERDVMYQLAFSLGTSDRKDQLNHLETAIRQLETEEAVALEEQRRYEKMCRSLGLLAGAFIVILIY